MFLSIGSSRSALCMHHISLTISNTLYIAAYGWLKCEKQEDKHCYAVLQADANITGRQGSLFFAEDHYVRLSLIRSQDDFDLLLDKLNGVVAGEEGARTM